MENWLPAEDEKWKEFNKSHRALNVLFQAIDGDVLQTLCTADYIIIRVTSSRLIHLSMFSNEMKSMLMDLQPMYQTEGIF